MVLDTNVRDAELVRQAALAIRKGVTGVKIEFEAALFEDEYNDGRHYVCGEWTIERCSAFLLEELHKHRLARKVGEEFKIKKPIAYSEVYDDMSVDTEWTVTLALSKAEDILLLPVIGECWKALLDAVASDTNREADLQNAGMHMALLFGKDAYYTSDAPHSERDLQRYNNFKRSMSMLLPALFFFGANSQDTRKLYFRVPQCGAQSFEDHRVSTRQSRYDGNTKFSAIHYVGNALEFRVFDPCYDEPDHLLDNFVVMRNCLRFWRDNYMSPHLEKYATSLQFGKGLHDTMKLEQLYTTAKHLDVLNAGIRKLKPPYLTVKELKEQRGFELRKRWFIKQRQEWQQRAEAEYISYKRAFAWKEKTNFYKHMQYKFDDRIYGDVELAEDIIQQLSEEALADAQHDVGNLETAEQYIKKYIEKLEKNQAAGTVSLVAN